MPQITSSLKIKNQITKLIFLTQGSVFVISEKRRYKNKDQLKFTSHFYFSVSVCRPKVCVATGVDMHMDSLPYACVCMCGPDNYLGFICLGALSILILQGDFLFESITHYFARIVCQKAAEIFTRTHNFVWLSELML